MSGSRVTLMDVAQRAGVSRTTASFVMTGRRDMRISSDAEQRVMKAARELNYRPSLLARSLRTNLSQTIGLLSDVIASEAFAGELIRGSMASALLHDHLMFIGETEGDPELEKRLVQSMLDRGVGGFLYASLYTRNVRVSRVLREQQLVLLNCLCGSAKFPAVIPDEKAGGRAAAAELLRHGHRDGIVLVGERLRSVVAAVERCAGIEEELAGSDARIADFVDTLWWPEPAHQAVHDYLAAGHRPTAFICYNDRIAMGVYQAGQDFGLRVPHDFSVVSFDDSDLACWLAPKLTSVAIPHLEMGRRAVELLLDPAREAIVHRVPMPLRPRESVGPPPAHQESTAEELTAE